MIFQLFQGKLHGMISYGVNHPSARVAAILTFHGWPVWTSLEPSNHPTVQPGKLWMFNCCQLLPFLLMAIRTLVAKPWGCVVLEHLMGQSVIIHFPSPLESQETSHCSKIFTSLVKKKAKGIRRTVLRFALKDLVKCCPTMPLRVDPTCIVSRPGDTTWPDSWVDAQIVFYTRRRLSTAYKDVFPGLYPWQQHVPTLEIESLFQNLPDIVTWYGMIWQDMARYFVPYSPRLTILMRRLKRNKRSIIGSSGKAAAVILVQGVFQLWRLFQCHTDST